MREWIGLCCALAAGAWASSAAVAEDDVQEAAPRGPAAQPDLVAATEVVVTATSQPAENRWVPAAVTRVDARDAFVRRGRRGVQDALIGIPSVLVQRTGPGQASPFVRGFTGYQTVLLVDGIRLNNSTFRSGPNQYWATIDSFAVGRVEVARGASSVLYGSDAVGGALNAVARELPTADGGRSRAFARWSSAEDSWTLRGEGSARSGALAVLAGATYRTYGDLRAGRPTQAQPDTGYRESAGDLRWGYDAGGDGRLTFGLQHVDQDDVPRTHKTVNALPFHGTTVGTELRRDLSQTRDLAYLRYENDAPGGPFERLVGTVSWQRQDEQRVRVRDTSKTDVQGTEVRTLGVQFQAEASSDAGYLTFGADGWFDDVSSFRNDFKDGVLDLARVQGPVADDATYHLLGLYVQDEIDVGRSTVTAGARLTHASLVADRVDDPAVGGGDPATPGNIIGIRDSWTSVVGSLRALHPLDDTWNAYGGVSQAFRAPNLSDLTRLDDTSGVETPSPGLDEERFVTFEVGAKGRGDGWTLDAAVWRTEIDGMIVPSPTGRLIGGTPEVRKDNIGDGWASGVEVEGSVRLSSDWTFAGAASWTDGEVDQLTPAGRTVRRPLSRLAPISCTATLTFARPGANWDAWIEGRAADRADELSLKDATDTSRIPRKGTPRYALLSVGAQFRASDVATLSVVLDNVFDVDYRHHGSGVNEAGRNVVLALDVQF